MPYFNPVFTPPQLVQISHDLGPRPGVPIDVADFGDPRQKHRVGASIERVTGRRPDHLTLVDMQNCARRFDLRLWLNGKLPEFQANPESESDQRIALLSEALAEFIIF